MADNKSELSSTASATPIVPPCTKIASRSSNPRKPAAVTLIKRKVRWSEEANAILISAWGEQYLASNRGKVKKGQWQHVAAKLTSSDPPRSEKQCRYRIENAKKKFKVEKAKVESGGGVSNWKFYTQMAQLIDSDSEEAKSVAADSEETLSL